MKTILKNKLDIITENEYELWCRCPAHRDINRPNLWVTKNNGFGYCFSCGFKCRVKGLNMKTEKVSKPKVNVNWDKLISYYRTTDGVIYIERLAKEWSVSVGILYDYEMGWNINHYTTPVYNELGGIIGIQKRYLDGQKIMVKGSQLGIFASSLILRGVEWLKSNPVLLITEGLSDTVVATHLGFNAIGRISCTSSIDVIIKLVKQSLTKGLKSVIIIADNDDVGTTGAEKLHEKLSELVSCDILWPLIGNDLREHYNHCGYKETKKWLNEKIND